MHKILHLIPTLQGGGAERQLALLAIEQAKRGYIVHIGVRRLGVHASSFNATNVFIHLLSDRSGLNLSLFFSIVKLIIKVRPEVVQTWLLQMDLIGGMAALCCFVPWVGTERSSQYGYNSKGLFIAAFLRKKLFRWAKAIVANSDDGANYWKELFHSGPKITKINNAVNLRFFEDQANNVTPAAGDLSLAPYKVLAVGRLVKSKGLNVLIEAINRMPTAFPINLLIIGGGPLYSDVESLIAEYKLELKIKLLPYDDSWWRELKGASLLVSMSLYEGQPNVVLETMAAGCPLVVSDIPAHREILSPDSALLVPVNDVDGLVAALVNALSDPVSSRFRALNARATIEGFTIEKAADAYDELYGSVVKGGSV